MKKIITASVALSVLLGITLGGCDSRVVIDPQPIATLYKYLAEYKQMPEWRRDSFETVDSLPLRAMFSFMGVDSLGDSVLVRWSESPQVKIFTPSVDSVYKTLKPIEATLGRIEAKAQNEGFVLPHRSYAAVVWGNSKSVVLTDSCVLIALNHYLGPDYIGYKGWPEYLRLQKSPEQLPYDVTEALLATQYPYNPGKENTVLSRIAYEGALIMAKVRLVPQGTLERALGCTATELQWLEHNQADIWNMLVAKEFLYSTSQEVASRLVDPAPRTSVLGAEVPGRAGRFLGYYLILQYLQANPETSLPSHLQPGFYTNPAVLISE